MGAPAHRRRARIVQSYLLGGANMYSSLKLGLGTTRVRFQNGISIGSAVFAQTFRPRYVRHL